MSAALGRSDGRLGAAGCSRPEAPCMRQGSVRPHCVHLAWIRIKLATCLPPTGQQLPGVQGGDAAAHQVRCARCGLLPLCTPWPTHAAPAPAVHWCAGLLQPVPVAPRFLLRQRLGPCSDAPPTSRLQPCPPVCVCLRRKLGYNAIQIMAIQVRAARGRIHPHCAATCLGLAPASAAAAAASAAGPACNILIPSPLPDCFSSAGARLLRLLWLPRHQLLRCVLPLRHPRRAEGHD